MAKKDESALMTGLRAFVQEPEAFERLSTPDGRKAVAALEKAILAAGPEAAEPALRLLHLACGEFLGLRRPAQAGGGWEPLGNSAEENPHFLCAEFKALRYTGRVPLPLLQASAVDPRKPKKGTPVEAAAAAVCVVIKPMGYSAAVRAGTEYISAHRKHLGSQPSEESFGGARGGNVGRRRVR